MSGLHEACARAIADVCDSCTPLGDPAPLGPRALDQAAAAALRVCFAEREQLLRERIEALIGTAGVDDDTIIIVLANVLAVFDA